MNTSTKATALLDAIGYGTDKDRTAEHRERARRFEGCFRSGADLGAWRLVRLLRTAVGNSRDAPRAAAALAKLAYVPVTHLAWAWADVGPDPGMLDLRPRRAGFDDRRLPVDGETAMGAVLRYWSGARAPRGLLVLSGETGTGKSVGAVFAAVHYGGRFLRAPELGEMALGSGKQLKALAREPVLVIDELGRETDIRPTPTRVTELLGDRHDQGLATIVTTQLRRTDPDASMGFTGRYGHHLLDRVERAGRWVSLVQSSRRNDASPRLEDITKSARIAILTPRVDGLTGGGEGAPEDVDELARLLGVSDEDLERAAVERDAWRRPLLEKASGLTGIAGSIVRSAVANG